MSGIRINEIPLDATLAGTDLVHVYKNVSGTFKSVAAPVSAVAFQGLQGDTGAEGARGDRGDDGKSTAQLVAYARISPNVDATLYGPGRDNGQGAINDDGSYNFGNRVYTTPQNTGPNNDVDWYAGPPSVLAGTDNSNVPLSTYNLWSVFGVAQITGLTGTDENIEWSVPERSGIDGQPGSDGRSTYQAVVFTRSENQPATPFGGSFNFGTDTLVPPTGSDGQIWYRDTGGDNGPPEVDDAGGYTGGLWMCNQQFSVKGDTGTDQGGSWSTPTRFAQDGADGKSTYYGLIYKRTNASFFEGSSVGDNTGLSAANGYYDFRANGFVLPNGEGEAMEGWYETPPAEFQNGAKTPLYMSSTVATVTGDFLDTLPMIDKVLSWSDAVLVQTPAVDGNQGSVVSQLKVYKRSVGVNPPATPTGGSFNFTDAIITAPTDWSTIPIESALDTTDPDYAYDFLWVSTAVAAANWSASESAYPTDSSLTWSTPIKSGEDGLDAVSTYLAQCYTRYSGDVDMQTATYAPTGGSYNFGTNVLQPPVAPGINPLGVTWSNTIPTGLGQIYISQQQFATVGNVGTKSGATGWSTPAVMAYDGAAGFSGVTNASVTLYYAVSSVVTGSDIPNFPHDLNVKVDLLSTSSNFGKITSSFISGGGSADISITSKQVMSGVNPSGWYTELPTISASDGTPLDIIYATQAIAADSDMGDNNHVDSISGSEFSDSVLMFKPGSNGLVGLATGNVTLFQRSITNNPPSPNKPTGDVNFYVLSSGDNNRGSFSVPPSSTLNNWLSVTPSFSALDPGGAKHYLWGITAAASTRESFDTITDTEWSSPFLVSQQPFDLTETTVSHIVQAFKNSSDTPTDNPGTCTVSMTGENAGIITTSSLENGWSKTLPESIDGQDLYLVQATASTSVNPSNTTDQVLANEWSSPAKFSGPTGARGLAGGTAKVVQLYKRTGSDPSDSAKATPTLSGSYNFNTDSWTFGDFVSAGPGVSPGTGTSNNWSFLLPAKDATDRLLFHTFATAISTQDNLGIDIIGGNEWNTPNILSQDGDGLRFLGEFADRATFTAVGNYPISGLENGDSYYDQTLNQSFTFVKATSAFTLIARDGKEIASIKRTNNNTEVTISYDNGTSDTFSLSDGGLLEIGDVVRDSSTGTVTMELSVNGVRNAKTFNIANGDGIASVSAYDIPNATNPTATRVVLITDNGDARPPFDVVRGLPGLAAGVAAVYADDALGTNASFTVGTREFVKYHEFTGTAPAILSYTYNPSDFTSNGHLTGGFTKFVGNSGTSITPIYASASTGASTVSLTQGSLNFVNFFEGAVASVDATNVTKADGSVVAVNTLTFVQIKGDDGTSVTIKDTLSQESDLDGAGINPPSAGDAYIIGGDLFVYSGSGTGQSSFTNVGPIQGPKGDSVKGDTGDTVTPIFATTSSGTGATLTQTQETVFVLFFSGNPLSTGSDVSTALASISNPVFTKFKGVGVSNITFVSEEAATTTTGRKQNFVLTFDDGSQSDTFTITDGAQGPALDVTKVERDPSTGVVTMTFDTNGDGSGDTSKTFTVADGVGIESITATDVEESNGFISGKSVVIKKEDGNETSFIISNGNAINVAVVYADDELGTNASFTKTSTANFVKYHEYTNSAGLPVIAEFRPSGNHQGGYTKFVGEEGAKITPIYADDSGGTNASLTQGTKTFVNFFEGAITSISGTTITKADNTTISTTSLTYVDLRGERGLVGETGRPNGFEGFASYSNNAPETITYDASANELIISEHDGGGDPSLGIVYPAINVEDFHTNGQSIRFNVNARLTSSISTTASRLYVRVFETINDLPVGKLAIGGYGQSSEARVYTGDATTGFGIRGGGTVAGGGRFSDSSGVGGRLEGHQLAVNPGYSIGDGSGGGALTATEFKNFNFEYFPLSSAKFASIGILAWNGTASIESANDRGFVSSITPVVKGNLTGVSTSIDVTDDFVDGHWVIHKTTNPSGKSVHHYLLYDSSRGDDGYGPGWQLIETTDKALHLKSVIPSIVGNKGDKGDAGTSVVELKIYRKDDLSRATPSTSPGTAVYIKPQTGYENGSLVFDPGQDNGWTTDIPSAESTKRIFQIIYSIAFTPAEGLYSQGAADASIAIGADKWPQATTFSLTPGRAAPVVNTTVVYDVLNGYHSLNSSSTTTNFKGHIGFRKKNSGTKVAAGTTGSVNLLNGYGNFVGKNDAINTIGQIIWHPYDAAGNDQNAFWEGMKQSLQILWKYNDKWILFQRTGQVDNASDYRLMNVSVVEQSENLSKISDLPGQYVGNNTSAGNLADSSKTPFVLGYNKIIENEDVYLYKRTDSLTAPAKTTTDWTYNFSTRELAGADTEWYSDLSNVGTGTYLWRIQATASGIQDDASGIFSDTITTSEWSEPIIFSQDGAVGPTGKSFFQKFLYTRVQKESDADIFLASNWTSLVKPETLDIVTNLTGSEAGDVIGNVRADHTSRLNRTGVVWSETIPSETEGNHLYVIIASVIDESNSTYTSVPQSSWTTPVKLSKDGVGINTATVRLYKRTSGEAPTDQYVVESGNNKNLLGLGQGGTVSLSYTFSTGNFNVGATNLNGWSQAIPTTGGSTLWVSRATASSTSDTDTINASEWSAPEVLVTDGSGLVFIGQFSSRSAYKARINSVNYTYNGIPPKNSYHIEPEVDGNGDIVYYTEPGTGNQIQRNVSLLYIGPQTPEGINDNANFTQLTIDGQPGIDGYSTNWLGAHEGNPGTASASAPYGDAYVPKNGDIYRNTTTNKVLIFETNAWEILTEDGAPGADSTVQGPDGKRVFICYNNAAANPDNPPAKPVNSNDGTSAGWTTTSSANQNWMSQKVANVANDASISWGDPILITGEQGEAGYKTITLKIFKRSSTRPTPPPPAGNNRGAYYFGAVETSVGQKFAPPAGWSTTVKNTQVDNDGSPPADPTEEEGYEWSPGTVNHKNQSAWIVSGTSNLANASLRLWSCEAVASVQTTDSLQIDDSLYWSNAVLEQISGIDLDSVDVDRVFGSVKNGGGVSKIVATDRLDNLLTQAAYDALANTTSPNRTNLYGWRNAGDPGGVDTVQSDTLYLIF